MVAIVDFERQILEEAASSPTLAVMRLSLEIDRELRKLLAVTGILDRYQGQSLPEALNLLPGYLELHREVKEAVTQFWSVRNWAVHGDIRVEHVPLRALDYGLRVLRLFRAIPRHSYVVIDAQVPVYEDRSCEIQRGDVKGVIVETISPEAKSLGKHIYPTTRFYSSDTSVSWEWNKQNRQGWGPTWYRDPESKDIKLAWRESFEFVGRDLNEV